MKNRYIVAAEESLSDLIDTVNERIKEGYLPIGGFFARSGEDRDGYSYVFYYQPLLFTPPPAER